MTAVQDDAPTMRPADPSEDDMLSRILCNAFLPLWNHNWFHGVSQPLQPVGVGTKTSTPRMTAAQRSRVAFYRGIINLTRSCNGGVFVVEVTGAAGAAEPEVGAILMWFPPDVRPSTSPLNLYRTGFLSLMLPWNYGLTGLYRVDMVFEANVKKMWEKTLPELSPKGLKEHECAFVQMLASNPKFAGKGYASALLKWGIEQHFLEFPDRPVILDTTTTQGIRAYERLGFKLLAETPVDTGTDKGGIKLKNGASEEVRKEAREICVQRVMAKLPESA
jgi:GNAT superfamily N-acetyltransferase